MKTLKLENGISISEGLCTCLKCNIKIKLIDLLIDSHALTSSTSHYSKLGITQGKVYNLIFEYGISKYGNDFIIIETSELIYYINK